MAAVQVAGAVDQYSTANGRRAMAKAYNGDLYLAYTKSYSGNTRLFLSRSSDDGATWTDTTATPIDNSGCLTASYPALAISTNNVLWLAYASNLPGACTTGRMGVSSASVSGADWSPWASIPGAYPYSGYTNTSDIAVAGDNSIHLVWGDQDLGAPSGYGYGWVVKYSSRSAGGSSWSPYSTLPGSTGDATAGLINPTLAIDRNNVLHAVSRQCGSAYQALYRLVYSSRAVAGTGWSGPVSVIDLTGNGRDQGIPSLAIEYDPASQVVLHLVWSGQDDTNTTNAQIKYSFLNAGDAAWSAWTNIQPISQTPQTNASIATGVTFNLFVAWSGADAAGGTKKIKYSRYNGATWSDWVNLAGGSYDQDYPTLRWAGWYNNGGNPVIP